jgi:hypothetical protein
VQSLKQTRNLEAIRRLLRVLHNRAVAIKPQPAIFPGYTAPVVRNAADGGRAGQHVMGIPLLTR